MSSLDIYIFVVVPATLILLGVAGLWLQAQANRRVQKHIDRLMETRLISVGTLERINSKPFGLIDE
jgi:hypothetical protein